MLDVNGKISETLKDFNDPRIERVHGEMNVLTFVLHDIRNIRAEQELLFRGERYRVTLVQTNKGDGGKYTEVEAMSAFIELNDRRSIGELEFTNQRTIVGADRILKGTGWEMGTVESVPGDDARHSFKEEDNTKLWLIRQFARIAGYEVEFDTINKLVNFVLQVGTKTDEVIRYRKNLRGITKTEEPTRATVIYPRGRGGLTIEAVNDGTEYIEDYTWYTDELGIPLAEAKKRYRKEYIWEDDRFIYGGTLMREAKKKIRELSRPVISYETSVLFIGTNALDVGDYAYLIDEELGIRLSVRVVRIIDNPGQEERNEIELNYLIPGLGGQQDQATEPESGQISTVLIKNEEAVKVQIAYRLLLELSVSSFASSNLQAGLYIIGKSSTKATLTGYFTFRGERLGPEIKQTVDGWETIGLPFMLLQAQEGTGYLSLYLSIDSGSFDVARHDSELYITGTNLLGGLSSKVPRANVIEEVTFGAHLYVSDTVSIDVEQPIKIAAVEEVAFADPLDVTDLHKPAIINKGSLIPEMLSNDKPEPVYIYADTSDAAHQPYLAMDKRDFTYWQSTSDTSRITIDFSVELTANRYRIMMKDVTIHWTLQATNDEVNWEDIDTNNYTFVGKEEIEFTIPVAGSYRYYRWAFDNMENIKVYELDLISEVLLLNE